MSIQFICIYIMYNTINKAYYVIEELEKELEYYKNLAPKGFES